MKRLPARAAASAALIVAVGFGALAVGCVTSRGAARPSPDTRAAKSRAKDAAATSSVSAPSSASTKTGAASAPAPPPAPVPAAKASVKSGAPAAAPAKGKCTAYSGPVDSYVTILDFGIPKVLQYPAAALAKDVSGMVKVHTLVGTDGSVCQTEVIEGPPLLHEAAMQAARETRIRPAMKDGRPVAMWVVIPFVFSLPDKAPAGKQTARR